jgi:transcriptional regulator with XRE-family HTH domain
MSETIGQRIKRLRELKGMSQHAMGESVGVSRVSVTKWESGDTSNMKLHNLKAVCRLFKMTAEELIDGVTATASENYCDHAAGNISSLPVGENRPTPYIHPNRDIAEAVSIMEQTDDNGRQKALGGIRVALHGHIIASEKQA